MENESYRKKKKKKEKDYTPRAFCRCTWIAKAVVSRSPVDVSFRQDAREGHACRPGHVAPSNPCSRLRSLCPEPGEGSSIHDLPRRIFSLLALAQDLRFMNKQRPREVVLAQWDTTRVVDC